MEEMEEGLVPWLLWRLWKNRNEFIFRSKDYHAMATVTKAREDSREWLSRLEVGKEVVKKPITEVQDKRWTPPPISCFKCNTDGSWSQHKEEGGAGWVLRDHEGRMLWAGAKKILDVGSAIETEAEALRWSMASLLGLGYKDVMFETDSQVIVKMLQGAEEVWPRLKPIMQELSILLSGRNGFEVRYYNRSGNKVADRIAKETDTFTSIVPTVYSIVPSWLISFVEADKYLVRH